MMSGDEVSEDPAQSFHAFHGVQCARRRVIDFAKRCFDMSLVAGRTTNVALKRLSIFAEVMPKTR